MENLWLALGLTAIGIEFVGYKKDSIAVVLIGQCMGIIDLFLILSNL